MLGLGNYIHLVIPLGTKAYSADGAIQIIAMYCHLTHGSYNRLDLGNYIQQGGSTGCTKPGGARTASIKLWHNVDEFWHNNHELWHNDHIAI